MVDSVVWDIGYLVSAALFIFGIKRLSSPKTAPQGNRLGAYGMFLAVLVTLVKMYSCLLYTSPSPRDQRGAGDAG